MKVVFVVFIIFFLSLFSLSSISIELNSVGVCGFSSPLNKISLKEDNLAIKTAYFSFGSIGQSGLFGLIEDPFISASLTPSITASKKETFYETDSFITVFNLFGTSQFFVSNRGLGFSSSFERFSVSSLYVSKEEDYRYQTKRINRIDEDRIWTLFSFTYPNIKLLVLSSLSSFSSFSVMAKASISFSIFTFSFGKGRVKAITQNSKEWDMYYGLEIKNEELSYLSEVKMKEEPKYLDEYRDYEYKLNVKLSLGDFVFKNTIKKSFLDGKIKRSEDFSISYKWISATLKNGKDIVFSLEKNGITIAVGYMYFKVKATIRMENENNEVEFSLKQNNEFSVKIRIDI